MTVPAVFLLYSLPTVGRVSAGICVKYAVLRLRNVFGEHL